MNLFMNFLIRIFVLGILLSTQSFANTEEQTTMSCAPLNDDGSILPSKFNQVRIVSNKKTGQSKMWVVDSFFTSLDRYVELPLIYSGFPMADSNHEHSHKAFYLAATVNPEQQNMMAELTLDGPLYFDRPTDGALKFGYVMSTYPLVTGKYVVSRVRCYAN